MFYTMFFLFYYVHYIKDMPLTSQKMTVTVECLLGFEHVTSVDMRDFDNGFENSQG